MFKFVLPLILLSSTMIAQIPSTASNLADRAALTGAGLVAQANDSNYAYYLIAPSYKNAWSIICIDNNATTNTSQKTIYTGVFPFRPEPPSDLKAALGTPVLRSLITQWAANLLAAGHAAANADFMAYYEKNGRPEYTGLTAEILRSQGADPDIKPPSKDF